MTHYNIFTPETAPSDTREVLQAVTEKIGFLPNVFAVLGGTPAALSGFVELNRSFGKSTFSVTEREIIQIAASVENDGAYCVAGHTSFTMKQDVDKRIINAVRTRHAIDNPKLAALHEFSRLVTIKRGKLNTAELEQFFEAGYSESQALEVILGVCVKMFSNIMDNLLKFPLDEAFTEYAWDPKSAVGFPEFQPRAA